MEKTIIDTASVIIKNEKGLILSVSRKNNHSDMNLPGGKREPEDLDIIDTLRRETREETGLELEDIVLIWDEDFEYKGKLYHEHTFTAKGIGEINYDFEKEPAIVKWVEPEVVMDGSFGDYNEKVLGLIGIKRRTAYNEKRYEESSIAKLRNKLSPIVNYFEMRKILDNPPPEMTVPIQIELFKLMEEQYKFIQSGNLDEVLALVKNDDMW